MERTQIDRAAQASDAWQPKRYGKYLITGASRKEFVMVTALPAAGGAVATGVAIKGGLIFAAAPLGPFGVAAVCLAGGAIGAGAAYGAGSLLSPTYRTWINATLDGNITRIVIDQAAQDDILRTYLCPISQMLPIQPVEAPDGNFYEKKELAALADNQGNIEGYNFQIEELKPAPKLALAIFLRMQYLVEQDIQYSMQQSARNSLARMKTRLENDIKETTSKIKGTANITDWMLIQGNAKTTAISPKFLTWKGKKKTERVKG